MTIFVLRDGAAGLFLAASKFPKVRETRAPKVAELRTVADQLDPKYQFILQAPDVDPEGNPTLVKFSRKNQSQYIGSETLKASKPNGRWSIRMANGLRPKL